ncbi:hypothetical protein DQ04_18231010 [Trypanosoma grayi]|uniref:hypothetical protein n=1 Tax=Trypanosoma grayi TaxID=71804 RepID=UPI0004F4B2C1|nr:hypothetical protein DQ04_18231010 [Trypanosoma grayi]KEG05811.1 hypothetical protein DQ04_18231010 [Trypanosoma grayi]
MTRLVLGARGRTVRGIEDATGAAVRVGDDRITLHGSAQAVEAARAMIQDLRREEARVPLDPTMMQLLTTALVEVNRAPAAVKQQDEAERADTEEQRKLNHEEVEEEEGGAGEAPKPHEEGNDNGEGAGACTIMLTPLQAIQQTSQCEFMTPLRAEGVVLLRGKQECVNQARVMLKDFALRCRPHAMHIPFSEVLFTALTRPRDHAPSIMQQLARSHSSLLRVQLKREEEVAVVTSPILEEVEAAAKTLRDFIVAKTATSVRCVRDFPPHRIGLLMGTSSRNLKALEERTGTHIAVRRAAGEVQVFRDDGDEEALAAAVDAVTALAKESK